MKNRLFTTILIAVLLSNFIQAQSPWGQNGSTIYYGGNVGIGTSTPTEKLEVDGNTIITNTLSANDFHVKQLGSLALNSNYVVLLFEKDASNANFVSGKFIGRRATGHLNSHEVEVYVNHGNTGSVNGSINYRAIQRDFIPSLVSCDYNGKSYIALRFVGTRDHRSGRYFSGHIRSSDPANMLRNIVDTDPNLSNIVTLPNTNTIEVNDAEKSIFNGSVGIGTDDPQSKLAVDGTIRANKVRVMGDIQGADFVFEPEYDLRPLAEIEAFIKAHQHLPEIPSAKEMKAQGLDLAELNIQLLQKVEELTLYLIEQDKKIEGLEESIECLQKE